MFELVTAWTETKKTRSIVMRATSPEACAEALELAEQRGLTICPRGAGYSFGDMILNDGQMILDTSGMNKILAWNPTTGRLTVQPGVRVAQVFQHVLGSCWTLPSCTGGMGVTMGGAISNNVHGKDSWKVGNFGDHVISVTLLTAAGTRITIPRTDTERLRAVISGMGMLGIALEITLQLIQTPSPFVEVVSKSVRCLRESLDTIESARGHADFLISWVDAFAQKNNLGRGTVQIGRWIDTKRRPTQTELMASLMVSNNLLGFIPAAPAWAVGRKIFRPWLMQCANSVKYNRDAWRGGEKTQPLFTDFNFMLNKIPGWKSLYQPHGYLEFQPLIPRAAGPEALEHILKLCQRMNSESLLCAIKLHPRDDYYLSFEGDGYSVGIDIALKGRKQADVQRFAQILFDDVVAMGGKTFLAKDELISPSQFRKMFPAYRQFWAVKQQMDPTMRFASDMQRRLFQDMSHV